MNGSKGADIHSLSIGESACNPASSSATVEAVLIAERKAAVAYLDSANEHDEHEGDCPVGIPFLAVFHILGGLILVGAQVQVITNWDQVSAAFDIFGFPATLLVVGILLLAGVVFASGVGMLLRARWGWWCAAFYYVFSVARNGHAYLMASSLTESFHDARDLGNYKFRFAGRFIIHLLLLIYLFKPHVMGYFGLQRMDSAKALGILIAITAAVFAVSAFVARLVE